MDMLKLLGIEGAYRPLFVIDEALGLQYKGLSKDEKEIYDWRFQDFNMNG